MPIYKYNPKRDALNFPFSFHIDERDALHAKLSMSAIIDANDLRRVVLWKSGRVLNVSTETLSCLHPVASKRDLTIGDTITKLAITLLVDSHGIGLPMASAILKFIRPDIFPIIDVRAYRVLNGRKPSASDYSYDGYVAYARSLKLIAAKEKRPLRDIDEQLYCLDKSKDRKI